MKVTAMQLANQFGIHYWQVSEALCTLRNGSLVKNYEYDYDQAKDMLIKDFTRKMNAATEAASRYSEIINRISLMNGNEVE